MNLFLICMKPWIITVQCNTHYKSTCIFILLHAQNSLITLITWERSSQNVIYSMMVWVRGLKSDGWGSSPTFESKYLPIHQDPLFSPTGHTSILHFSVSLACNMWNKGRDEPYFFLIRSSKTLPHYQPLSAFLFQTEVSVKGYPEESPPSCDPEWCMEERSTLWY